MSRRAARRVKESRFQSNATSWAQCPECDEPSPDVIVRREASQAHQGETVITETAAFECPACGATSYSPSTTQQSTEPRTGTTADADFGEVGDAFAMLPKLFDSDAPAGERIRAAGVLLVLTVLLGYTMKILVL